MPHVDQIPEAHGVHARSLSMKSASPGWRGSGELIDHVLCESERTLQAYRTQPTLIREHVGIEANIFSGGYGRRQIFELIQNAADAISTCGSPGRVTIVLTDAALYCANEGSPIDRDGVTAILSAYLSQKRGSQIGHFGLGFKSVLNVTSTPQFFCRAGSFAFDLHRSRELISAVVPDVQEVPVLRLAHALDPEAEAGKDPELSALMEWATTVVRLPRNHRASEWLSEEIAMFPASFLVFSPHVAALDLVDRTTGRTRNITVEAEDQIVSVSEDAGGSAWAVFRRDILTATLTEAEFDDADRAVRQRDVLPVIWAVPETSSRTRGRFWAFFPTETDTTLSGILNAPWKTNADRQNLLDGPFNRRLIAEFVSMIAAVWPELLDEQNPGELLDLLPAREQDEKNWADSAVGQGVYRELAAIPSVPAADSRLAIPSEVLLRPDESSTEGVRHWLAANPSAEGEYRSQWVHPSVETRERRPRADRLGTPKGSFARWLVDIASARTPAACRRALELIERVGIGNPETELQIRSAAFVLTSEKTMVCPDPQRVCLPVRHVESPEGIRVVHKAVAADADACTVLKRLGIRELGVEVQLEHELRGNPPRWELVWHLLRELPQDSAGRFVRGHRHELCIRNLAGEFVAVRSALLPGILGEEVRTDCDAALLIDIRFHRQDLGLLAAAGATDRPRLGVSLDELRREEWFPQYLDAARRDYRKHEARGHDASIVGSGCETAGPLHALVKGSQSLGSRLTEQLMSVLPTDAYWTFHYDGRPRAYKTTQFLEPTRWCLNTFGIFSTSLGPRPASECVGRGLDDRRQFFPVVHLSAGLEEQLGIPQTLAQLSTEHWQATFERALQTPSRLEHLEALWELYAQAASVTAPPASMVTYAQGACATSQPTAVQVCDDRDRFNALQETGTPAMLVSTRAALETLLKKWNCREGRATVGFEAVSDHEPLLDALPGLAPYALPSLSEGTFLQACARIWLEVKDESGSRHFDVSFARVGGVLCYRADISKYDLLRRAAQQFGMALNPDQILEALAYSERSGRDALISKLQAVCTVQGKLVAALGSDAIARQLPARVVTSALGRSGLEPSELALGRAAVAVFGVELLKAYTAELADAGFDPPRQWNGSKAALTFCQEFGFPLEYAGFPTRRRDPMLELDGPLDLQPLHDFQQVIADRIRAFFLAPQPGRGLLSLPTGAGKTRVVIEALIGGLKRDPGRRLIVWIAQSDELCEQAVQAWAQVWRSMGPARRLRISRLWGATNDLARSTDTYHVVVSTYQSLGPRLSSPQCVWLLKADAVIVDEAHGATARSFTEILQAFGLTAQRTERHLIGLTATPFRGSGLDEKDTQWLANRFGASRFDQGVMPDADPYRYLQERGILSAVSHQVLPGGSLHLSGDELDHLNQYRELPSSAEQRLGDDDVRNRALLECVAALDPGWPVLLFSTSVNHAQLMAALLSLHGIEAKAVSGETSTGARRHYINEFKAGRIRVLTNYGVLTTGFDAPAVRAVIIARPVYSRSLYQQMIGRGLRGPLNGGKEHCLIVNVADNVAQFGERLAFADFEHLWKPWVAGNVPQ